VKKYREARAESGREVKPKSNEDYILQRLHDAFESNFASRLTTQQIVKFAQDRRKAGAGGYTVDMDISKLGTVLRHMGSLINLTLPDAVGTARPTLHHLRLIEAGNKRDRRPTPDEIEKIFAWFAEHPERQQAMPDLLRVAMQCAFRRGELFNLRWFDIDAENHLALVRDRKHPRQKIGNNEWIPLIGDSFEVIMRQPRYAFASPEAAKAAAQARLQKLNHHTAKSTMTMTGRADFAAEKTVTLKGFKKEADGDFLIESVTNTYAGRSWETQVELNAGNRGKAKVGHEKKKGRRINLVVPAPPH